MHYNGQGGTQNYAALNRLRKAAQQELLMRSLELEVRTMMGKACLKNIRRRCDGATRQQNIMMPRATLGARTSRRGRASKPPVTPTKNYFALRVT